MTEADIVIADDFIGPRNRKSINVTAGKTVTVDLNGKIIDRGVVEDDINGVIRGCEASLFEVYGNLTVNDSSDPQNDKELRRARVSSLKLRSRLKVKVPVTYMHMHKTEYMNV